MQIEPELSELAKVMCCPLRSKRCHGNCETATQKYHRAAVAVREEYRAVNRPRLKE